MTFIFSLTYLAVELNTLGLMGLAKPIIVMLLSFINRLFFAWSPNKFCFLVISKVGYQVGYFSKIEEIFLKALTKEEHW